jgi:G3E family GTPase
MLRANGFTTEEISGGCFCCRFNSLVEASNLLREQARPDVFIAEPVGSCTDLVATVTFPLRRLYGDNFVIAPLSVLMDPIRGRRIFGLEQGGSFSEKVLYIYHKQLEEADIIVISKSDLVTATQIEELRQAISKRYPRAGLMTISARAGTGVDEWLNRLLLREQVPHSAMSIDYDTYADGEALLGWLNATVRLSAAEAFDGEEFLRRLASETQACLKRSDSEIAHLKMTLTPDDSLGDIAVVNLVRNDFVPELSIGLDEPVTIAQLIINLRAEADPDVMASALEEALPAAARAFPSLEPTLDHLEHFRPGRPNPTHRDTGQAK